MVDPSFDTIKIDLVFGQSRPSQTYPRISATFSGKCHKQSQFTASLGLLQLLTLRHAPAPNLEKSKKQSLGLKVFPLDHVAGGVKSCVSAGVTITGGFPEMNRAFLNRFMFLTICVWLGLTQTTGFGQGSTETDSSSKMPVITRDVILERPVNYVTKSWANLSLGNLEAGKRYQVELSVQNATNNDLSFSSITASCGCVKFETNAKTIPAGESTLLVFVLDTPKRNIKTKIGSGIRFIDDQNQQVFSIDFSYDLHNMFKILSSQVLVEVREQDESGVNVRVPVLVSTDFNPSLLEVQLSENLRDLQIKFVHENGETPHIELTVVKENVIGGAISGEIFLRRTGTKEFDSVGVVVRRREQVSIRPESVRLVKTTTDKTYTAKGILRIDDSVVEANKEAPDPQSSLPSVELLIDGQPSQVTLKKLGNSGVYAINIRFEGELPKATTEPVPARWGIRFGGRDVVIQTTAFFQE